MSIRSGIKFFLSFLSSPRNVGAIAPSSQRLARAMVEWIDWSHVRAVVEYGPGTGVFTEHILSNMHPGTKFFAIELDPTLVRILAERYPNVRVYQDSVNNVKTLCQQEGIEQIDAVICGLPWAAFTDDQQSDFMNSMLEVLKPGGQFATFAYLQGLLLPAGRRFKKRLSDSFSNVEYSRTQWLNLPPAFVYRCRP